MYPRNPTQGYTDLHRSDIRHLHSAPKHRYSPYTRPHSKPLSWSKANNWEWFPYNSRNQWGIVDQDLKLGCKGIHVCPTKISSKQAYKRLWVMQQTVIHKELAYHKIYTQTNHLCLSWTRRSSTTNNGWTWYHQSAEHSGNNKSQVWTKYQPSRWSLVIQMAQKSIGQWTVCSNIPNSSSSLIFLWN